MLCNKRTEEQRLFHCSMNKKDELNILNYLFNRLNKKIQKDSTELN